MRSSVSPWIFYLQFQLAHLMEFSCILLDALSSLTRDHLHNYGNRIYKWIVFYPFHQHRNKAKTNSGPFLFNPENTLLYQYAKIQLHCMYRQ